jgi:hypothetical protein
MSATIDNAFIQTYESTVRHLAQQGMSRLRPHVMEKSVRSEGHNWDLASATAASKKTSRKTATPDDETAFSRRKSIPVTYHTGDVTEQEDVVQLLIDPNSTFARAQGMAMKRAFDDEIIAAAVGASRDGAGNSVTFNADQNIGDGGDELNFDIVTEVSEKFMTNDIDPDEPKVMVIGPKQARKLLQLTEATSGDYNAVRPLASKGYVESWMGYTWLVSTRLQAPDTDEIYCFAMTKRALGMQINRDITVKVSEDPTISYAWRIYTFATFGAVRIEDEHLVRVHLADTVT